MSLELVGKVCLIKKACFIGNIGDGEVLSKQFPGMRHAHLNLIGMRWQANGLPKQVSEQKYL